MRAAGRLKSINEKVKAYRTAKREEPVLMYRWDNLGICQLENGAKRQKVGSDKL